MSIVYKGKYTDESQLPKNNLPENAVPFKEPKSIALFNLFSILFSIALIGFIIAIFAVERHFRYVQISIFGFPGLFFGLFSVIPLGLLQAVLYPKDSETYLYFSKRHLMLLAIPTAPVSKSHFILINIFSSSIFGWFPFVVWMIFPGTPIISENLLFFSIMHIIYGCSGYINAFNALTQMPKGSMTQLSGFHSYWFMPKR